MSLLYTESITHASDKLQTLLSGFVENTYLFINHQFRSLFVLCFLLYIIGIGYGVINGWFELAWRDFSHLMLKVVVVSSLLFSWPFFQTYLVDFFTSGVSSVVTALTSHVFSHSGSATASTVSMAQGLLSEVANVGLWVWKMAAFTSPLPIFLGIVLWVCGMGVAVFGFVQILIAKIMIALLLASSPFVLIFYLFLSFEKVTWAWVQLLLSNVFILLFVSIALNLSFYMLHDLFDELYKSQAKGIQILQLIPVILISVLSFVMIKRCIEAALYLASNMAPVKLGVRSNSSIGLAMRQCIRFINT